MAGYGTDQGLTDWLEANGYTLPAEAPTPAVLRQRGSAYVDGTYSLRFSGSPTGGAAQEREWPRTGATDRYGTALSLSEVPSRVEQASYMAAYQLAVAPDSLTVVNDPSKRVKRQKVDVIEREFFEPGDDAGIVPIMSQIEGILAPLLIPAAGEPHALVV